ncbi:hypothetical protein QNO08_01730 [Arthrobacter sp. zg-Y820]|uniref:hypothetical protein n=1 Tax=unclassified Arthrobacter TaxID=235627 RepID=UPI001E4FFE40|nr:MULTISPECIES: hypothetical protein [unclassified Arthrobacter]MCC9198368.1 hypothetical protein [Arthrobacter sp. zg-Y820]MDK1281238.1 hypothetical protein [Arthrobacter sp. zg.Y820]MDK1361454.1 hypothetical protein [Arthrobacter sp. zg-Y1219]WIB09825.1 hypothetical protein QNO08_01730 [Arthrobacter sp. zg-Y820]
MSPSQEAVDLLHEIAAVLRDDGPIAVGTMFRSPGLRSGKKIVAFLGSGDVLLVKLPRTRAAALVAEGSAEPVTMGSRTMREWVEIPTQTDPDATRTAWTDYAREAFSFVRGTA